MSKFLKPRAGWLLLLSASLLLGRQNKLAAIDLYCNAVRHEFVEAAPRYFSGPTPWLELDALPDTFADTAIATVYSEGPRITWLVLAMAGPGDGWFETTHYFFDEGGLIRKRERYFKHVEANVQIEELTYFEHGKVLKTKFHHSPLEPATQHKSREHWDAFYDPNAPEYASTADLPDLFSNERARDLAALSAYPGLRTCCTAALSEYPSYLLKFSR